MPISFLSMGAVFAILAGYYYWSPKIVGYMYNETLAKIQYWLFFIGVNITFMPMHFIGLAGQPRRIAQYPDSYTNWNMIISFGSIISFVSLILFLYILYKQFTEKILFDNIKIKDYFFSSKIVEYKAWTIEWVIDTVPKYHHFSQVPIC